MFGPQCKRITPIQSIRQKNIVYYGFCRYQTTFHKKINEILIDVHVNPVQNLSSYMKNYNLPTTYFSTKEFLLLNVFMLKLRFFLVMIRFVSVF